MAKTAEITTELAKGKFTEEMLANMRALIGTDLRTESCVNNEYATKMAIIRFCEESGRQSPLDGRKLWGKVPLWRANCSTEFHICLPRLHSSRMAGPWGVSL